MTLFIRGHGNDELGSDTIEWSRARALWLHAHAQAVGETVHFLLTVAMPSDVYIEIGRGEDCAKLRQFAAALSARQDVPFDDWTRPRPARLSPDEFSLAVIRMTLSDDDGDGTPKERSGTIADGCWLRGCADAVFADLLETAVTNAVKTVAHEGEHTPEDIAEAGAHLSEHEWERWAVLCTANGEPPHSRDLEKAN